LSVYKEKAEWLVSQNKAYYCFCSSERLESVREAQRAAQVPPKYDRTCRSLSAAEVATKLATGASYVIRLKVPDNEPISFTDLVRGEITVNSDVIDDQVLLKSDGFPTYHLGVVVDDHAMEITHVMRGEEWISSTPKHILLYKAFGWPLPVYGHVPIFLNPDGKGKMSKRKGTVSAQSFLDAGYLPEAMLNFLMILGWAREDQRELMTLDEYVAEFDPQDISSKSVVFDLDKLKWMNGVYIRNLSPANLKEKLTPFLPEDFPHEKYDHIIPLVFERLATLKDIEELTGFFYRPIEVDAQLLVKKSDSATVISQLKITHQVLEKLATWDHDTLEKAVRDLQAEHEWPKGQYFMMLRLALTGKAATPPLFETMVVIGQAESLKRLTQAIELVA
jgi:glutamyl-tRNA synthetase